jgi:hypothetical protein
VAEAVAVRVKVREEVAVDDLVLVEEAVAVLVILCEDVAVDDLVVVPVRV